MANASKELIGREWQATDGVYLVDEDYDSAWTTAGDDFSNRCQPPLLRAEVASRAPKLRQVRFEAERRAGNAYQAPVPLGRGYVIADFGKIDDRVTGARFAQ